MEKLNALKQKIAEHQKHLAELDKNVYGLPLFSFRALAGLSLFLLTLSMMLVRGGVSWAVCCEGCEMSGGVVYMGE